MPVYDHKGFSVSSIKGGYDKNFAYIIICEGDLKCVLVDAPLPLQEIIGEIPVTPDAVLLTHSHGDHTAFLNDYINKWPNISIITGSTSLIRNRKNFIYLKDMENFKIGGLDFTIIHTPGHFPDSVCFKLKDIIFTGDTLFVGRTGRTVSKGSSIDQLYDSVYNKLFTLAKDTMIYPGHDYGNIPRINMEENKKISPLLNADSIEDFRKIMKRYENERIK